MILNLYATSAPVLRSLGDTPRPIFHHLSQHRPEPENDVMIRILLSAALLLSGSILPLGAQRIGPIVEQEVSPVTRMLGGGMAGLAPGASIGHPAYRDRLSEIAEASPAAPARVRAQFRRPWWLLPVAGAVAGAGFTYTLYEDCTDCNVPYVLVAPLYMSAGALAGGILEVLLRGVGF